MQHKTSRKYPTHLTSQLHPSVDPGCAPICSVIQRWILGVCSICTIILGCAPHAASSITVDRQPFNIITYKYSLSSYNFLALYQLNVFKNLLVYWSVLKDNFQSYFNYIFLISVQICICTYLLQLHVG